MTEWQIDILEDCLNDDAARGEGAFAPGPAIWVGTREIAHFDNEWTLDVRLTKEVIRARRAELRRDDRVSLRSSASDWLELRLRTEDDVAWARQLIHDAIVANRATAPPGLPPTGGELDRRRRFH